MTTLLLGDCLELMRALPDSSVDSIVTDPPYGLSFMGKRWDYDVPSEAIWRECLRVLKPGGHLLAFAGTRTQHRMAVRIEDAGFEIRDLIAWVYSTGFPKSMNLDRQRGVSVCGCNGGPQPNTQNGTEEIPQHDMRPVRGADVPQAERTGEECRKVLQPSLPEQGAHRSVQGGEPEESRYGVEQPGMEGRRDAPQAQRELRAGTVHQSTGVGEADGAGGRLRDGAPAGDGAVVRLPADADGGGAPRGPRPAEQRQSEPRIVAGQPQPQAVGAWPVCGGCGLPVVPRGFGTALKPALEPITVARKPLVGTVAENVLAHGTGALNIDGCRVGTEGGTKLTTVTKKGDGIYEGGVNTGTFGEVVPGLGRWPANLIHDGSDEPVALLADAARFFYCAKASKADRDAGLDAMPTVTADPYGQHRGRRMEGNDTRIDGKPPAQGKNNHPTVKPTDLMRYLCRLVTPPGGLVLDPFMGSGSTGKAAILEGFRFIGCEMSAEYFAIANARIAAAISTVTNDIC